jgi:transcriptional adapter 2-alpha
VFDSSWTVAQELDLLDGISECGFANWTEISDRTNHGTAEDCRRHYEQFYLENPQPPLPEMPLARLSQFICPLPYKASTAPPRPSDDSSQQLDLSGYCCARSDFNIEHNNFAEMDIKDMTFCTDDTPLERELQLAVLRIYRRILTERQQRKWVVRQFGLIDISKHLVYCRRYEQLLGVRSMETLRRLSHLFIRRPSCFELCLEALSLEVLLRQRIVDLQLQRQAGLRWLRSSKVYSKILAARLQHNGFHLMNDVLRYIQESLHYQASVKQKIVYDKLSKNIDINPTIPVRRSAPPLDIVGLPGYDRLSHNEKLLCSRVRLVPESYLEFKRILVSEHDKHGHLRLAQARTLIRIDVNKTRQIYNFLIAEGLLSASTATVL